MIIEHRGFNSYDSDKNTKKYFKKHIGSVIKTDDQGKFL